MLCYLGVQACAKYHMIHVVKNLAITLVIKTNLSVQLIDIFLQLGRFLKVKSNKKYAINCLEVDQNRRIIDKATL